MNYILISCTGIYELQVRTHPDRLFHQYCFRHRFHLHLSAGLQLKSVDKLKSVNQVNLLREYYFVTNSDTIIQRHSFKITSRMVLKEKQIGNYGNFSPIKQQFGRW